MGEAGREQVGRRHSASPEAHQLPLCLPRTPPQLRRTRAPCSGRDIATRVSEVAVTVKRSALMLSSRLIATSSAQTGDSVAAGAATGCVFATASCWQIAARSACSAPRRMRKLLLRLTASLACGVQVQWE